MEWHEFYERRVGKSYVDYFKERYSLFLLAVSNISTKYAINTIAFPFSREYLTEIGCGIATASICLTQLRNMTIHAIDKSPEMLSLAKKNAKIAECDIKFEQASIPTYIPEYPSICFSHGVLEHFPRSKIKRYIEKLRKNGLPQVHYVPTNKYTYKSFGDERLFSIKDWEDIARPTELIPFNNDKDLVIIC